MGDQKIEETKSSKEIDLQRIPGCPWMDGHSNLEGLDGLDKEIRLFYEYMKPTREENKMRQSVVSNIKSAIQDWWPSTRVEVFGSAIIGVALPRSDIDMVLFDNWTTPPYRQISDCMFSHRISSDVVIIDTAAVPIVRVTDRHTEIQVDICFNRDNGLKNACQIMGYMGTYDELKYLVLVLKYYLSSLNLNEVYTGGISSYGLTMLIVNFLQNFRPREFKPLSENLGVALIEFLHTFGGIFDESRRGHHVANNYFIHEGYNAFRLCVIDPIDRSNNITKGSFRIAEVFNNFLKIYRYLSEDVKPGAKRVEPCFLSRLFKVEESLLEFRKLVKKYYA